MKKISILCIMAIFTYSLVLAGVPEIVVDKPDGSKTWFNGQEKLIKWSKLPDLNTPVKIRLLSADGNTKILDITNNTTNDGEFLWKVPGTGSINQNCYVIRVKTIDDKYSDDSNVFKIAKGNLLDPGIFKQTLKVLKPDMEVKNIYNTANCDIWVTVKNNGLIKLNKVMREKIWINGQLLSQEQTHFVIEPGHVFSHQILGCKAKFMGTTVKIFIDSDVPLNEKTKSNNTLEKTLTCIQRVKEKI